jgi:hypothetical protein
MVFSEMSPDHRKTMTASLLKARKQKNLERAVKNARALAIDQMLAKASRIDSETGNKISAYQSKKATFSGNTILKEMQVDCVFWFRRQMLANVAWMLPSPWQTLLGVDDVATYLAAVSIIRHQLKPACTRDLPTTLTSA